MSDNVYNVLFLCNANSARRRTNRFRRDAL